MPLTLVWSRLDALALLLWATLAPGSAAARPLPEDESPFRTLGPTAADVQTIVRFETVEPVIALTFDAGADRGKAEAILNTLAEKGARATFGMTGVWAEENPDLVRRIVREGHQLINHSWSHQSFLGLTSGERLDELRRTEALIQEQVGRPLAPYFRPPYGEYDESVLADLATQGYLINAMWSVDTLGWNGRRAAQITERVMAGAEPGAIILMHVGAQAEDAEALPMVIDLLRDRGFRFGTLRDFVEKTLPLEPRYFPETGHTVSGQFLQYWYYSGALPVFGFPLSDEAEERNVETAALHTVQYFERQRFELHPDLVGTPFEVSLGLLGVEALAEAGIDWRTLPKATPTTPHYFPETGHAVASEFWNYWRQYGLEFGDVGVSERETVALFGYPISEARMERNSSGEMVLTQWFERARFEYHPGKPAAFQVLLGRLGAELHDGQVRAP